MGLYTVEIGSVRLELGDGVWIEVKRELTYGDEQELRARALQVQQQAKEMTMVADWAAFTVEKIYRWLTDWSAVDDAGTKIPVTREAIRALPRRLGTRIEEAIDAHAGKMEQAKN